jgi:hypothetical protein
VHVGRSARNCLQSSFFFKGLQAICRDVRSYAALGPDPAATAGLFKKSNLLFLARRIIQIIPSTKRASKRLLLRRIRWAQNAILRKESVKGKSLRRDRGTKHTIAQSRRNIIRSAPQSVTPDNLKERASERTKKYYAHDHLGCADGLIPLRSTVPTRTTIHTPLVFAPILVFFAPPAGFCALARPPGSSAYPITN